MSWDEIRKARRYLSREHGNTIKDWGGRLPIALIYPNSYYIGMSCLGIHALYRMLNSHSGIVCERVFWEKGRHRITAFPMSLESQRPLPDFSLLMFSINYEIDYINVANVLRASGIPPRAADRNEEYPLIVAGGPCVTTNPLPLSPLFDLMCIGEAEPILPKMMEILIDGIGSNRDRIIEELSSLEGIYTPHYHQVKQVCRQWAKDLDSFPVASTVVTSDTELGSLYLIEVGRGCNWGCRFCMVSNIFSPVRFRSIGSLLDQAEEGLKYKKRLGLVGPAVTDHPQIEELVSRLRHRGANLSISSIRMKPLSPFLIQALAEGKSQSISFAPEAGSSQMRRTINKCISKEDILKAIDMTARAGIRQIKLYFMIGLPGERDEDIEDIIKITTEGKKIIDQIGSGTRVTVKLSPFVPKANTPFQRLPMAPLEILNYRLSIIKTGLQRQGIRVKGESPAWAEIQAIFARGNQDIAEVLLTMNDSSLSNWRAAVDKHNIDVEFYAHQKWPADMTLPWDVIDAGRKKSHELE